MAAPTFAPQHPAAGVSPARQRATSNSEFYSWIFMRISGILLVFLLLGHIAIMHLLEGGVGRVNFAFVAGRWAGPFWQTYDWALLFLATIHGANGMRIVITDYVRSPQKRFWAKMALYCVAGFMLLLGTLVIVTFNPELGRPAA
ncbi:succinate dehydrogenase hydrophobic membrane anchor subunit [soil metagenome]|jgi:succinate dehydrogenase / fumarate reductase membrane anchor subunit|nr:succinate dehydrogenase hydrophobic membrane anchor subunit [Euzebyaceae bacterium]